MKKQEKLIQEQENLFKNSQLQMSQSGKQRPTLHMTEEWFEQQQWVPERRQQRQQ